MRPATVDLTCRRGDTYVDSLRLTWKSDGTYIDLTGCTVSCQVRQGPDADVIVAPLVTLADQSTTPGGMTVSLTHTQTTALPPDVVASFDIQATNGDGEVTTYVDGRFFIVGDYTH